MRLTSALEQITEIRHAMARAAVFRGFRSSTVLVSALAAVGGAAAQGIFIRSPRRDVDDFLFVWFVVALASLGVIAGGALWRLRHATGPLQRDLAASAFGQFLPTLLAGAGLTFVIGQSARDLAWALPGLWLLLTGLGIFSSRRLLPRGTAAVGAWYLVAGLVVLSLDRNLAVSPWTMGIGFGVGQLFAAAVLCFGLERRHD